MAIFGEKKEGGIIILKKDPCSKGTRKNRKKIRKNFIVFYLSKPSPFYENVYPDQHWLSEINHLRSYEHPV